MNITDAVCRLKFNGAHGYQGNVCTVLSVSSPLLGIVLAIMLSVCGRCIRRYALAYFG